MKPALRESPDICNQRSFEVLLILHVVYLLLCLICIGTLRLCSPPHQLSLLLPVFIHHVRRETGHWA
jgi:hypothetical protein